MEQILGQRRSKQLPVSILILTVSCLLAGYFIYSSRVSNTLDYPESVQNIVYPSPVQLSEFTLTDHNNRQFGIEQLTNQWTFMFFGYTHCPDVCPATLTQMVSINEQVVESGLSIPPQIVFVSVDPKRDRANILAEYVRYFDENFLAVTAEIKMVEQLEQQMGVFHRYGRENSAGEYAVTHSAEIFLIDPSASVIAKFRPPVTVREIVQQYSDIVNSIPKNREKT